MSKGYFTIAQGAEYQRMAYAAALSLKLSQPAELSNLSIGVTSDEMQNINPKYREVFDSIVEIPWEDHAKNSSWKLENEWKVIHMTPYDETIKLDADMIFPRSIAPWWDALSDSEGAFCTVPKTYRGEDALNDFYRKTFTKSNLPNIYTAMFYFKKTPINFELFSLVEDIFNNWQRYFYEFLDPEYRPKVVSTDVVFALAAKIINYTELNNASALNIPSFVHMKSNIQNWKQNETYDEDWTSILSHSVRANATMMIENYEQHLPVHYHVKSFISDEILNAMEKELGI